MFDILRPKTNKEDQAVTARPGFRREFVAAVVSAVGLFVAAGALAATGFTGVAAGDMTAVGAVLWTRTVDAASGAGRRLPGALSYTQG